MTSLPSPHCSSRTHLLPRWPWLLVLLSVTAITRAQDFSVLPADKDAPPRQMVRRYLSKLADEAFARRRTELEKVKTPEQLAAYQQRQRQIFLDSLGPLPPRTPLNARTVGTIDDDGYRIEKVTFESQPGHVVTANLYLPDADGPRPGVVVPCGHSQSGKAAQQSICLALVKAGFVAMTYDPIGQGERVQMFGEDGKQRHRMTSEHTMIGASSAPVGRGTATYRIFDGLRAIDYLASRKEVDASKLGATGVSGGGTLTSYLMALDERIVCAAPSCYITSFPRLLATIGPQDAEQNLFGQIARGLDHGDYLIMRAPRPTLILAGTQDFFDIDGTWHSFREAKRAYTRIGAAERIAIVETDTKHGYPQAQREAMVRWMRRWLMNKDEPWTEPALKTRPERELLCTQMGQVMLEKGAVSVIDLNVSLAKELAAKRKDLWQPARRGEALKRVREISGIRSIEEMPAPKVREAGEVKVGPHTVAKLVIEPEPGIALPALLWKPAKPSGQRTLYLHGGGKHIEAQADGAIAKLVEAGAMVLAVDLRGIGELSSGPSRDWGGDWNDIFVSYLLGKSLMAMQAEDAIAAVRVLADFEGGGKGEPVNLIAMGSAAGAALHAGALERKRFSRVEVIDAAPANWLDAVAEPQGRFAHVIYGALAAYDLTDLAAAVRE